LGVDQDVVRRYVSVHDAKGHSRGIAQLVRRVQSAAEIRQNAEQDADPNPFTVLADATLKMGKRIAVHPLHDQIEEVPLFAEIENASDVRVLDPCSDAGFVQEHRSKSGVVRELG